MICNYFRRASLTAAALAAHPYHSVTVLTFLFLLRFLDSLFTFLTSVLMITGLTGPVRRKEF